MNSGSHVFLLTGLLVGAVSAAVLFILNRRGSDVASLRVEIGLRYLQGDEQQQQQEIPPETPSLQALKEIEELERLYKKQ